MKTISTITLFAAGLITLAAFTAPARADVNRFSRFPRHDVRQMAARQEMRHEFRNDRAERGRDVSRFPSHDVRRSAARQEIRGDWREIRKDRAELGRDQAELRRDRADLRNLYRNRASRGDIDRKKSEIRQDVREIYQDRREIREDYAELRRDRGAFGKGNYGRFGARQDWNRQDNSRWGRGWNSGRD